MFDSACSLVNDASSFSCLCFAVIDEFAVELLSCGATGGRV